jgi:uncharacterized protein YfdQ (DUF2303 family)
MAEDKELADYKFSEGTAEGVAVEAALEAGEKLGKLEAGVTELNVLETPGLAVPRELRIEWLTNLRDRAEQLRERPRYLQQKRAFGDLESFVEYVNEFKTTSTRLYGNENGSSVTATIDDHDAPGVAGEEARPRWGRHQAVLDLTYSEEWKAWVEKNREMMSHLVFVEFLSEQLSTIAKPDASGILSAARAFSASRSMKFDSVLPEEGGDLSVAFSEEVRGTTKSGAAALPGSMVLLLRPYRHLPAYQIEAQVKWRLSREGELRFAFALLGLERVLEKAFIEACGKIKDATELKVLL